MAKKEKTDFEKLDDLISKQFDDIINLSKEETKVETFFDWGIYSLNYISSKKLSGGVPKGRVTGIEGLSGCLASDTEIKIKRGKRVGYRKYTIKELYEKMYDKKNFASRKWRKNLKTYTKSISEEDNRFIISNEIDRVIYSGKKKTFILKTETGKEIRATEIHPFKVPDENINGRGVKEKNNYVQLKDLKIGEYIYCKSEDKFAYFGNNYSQLEKIISIEPYGEEDTYDIIMKGENKNFLANDIVVHNTGKSLLCACVARDPKIDYVVIIETEGGGQGDELMSFAGVDKSKVRIIKGQTFTSYKINKKTQKIEEIKDSDLPKNKDTDNYLYVEGITSKMRRFINACKFGGVKQNILIILDSLANIQSVRGLSGCYHPDTIIEILDKNDKIVEKRIKDAKEGEKILTHLGTYEEIEKVHNKLSHELIEIETEIGDIIKLTPAHPMLVERDGEIQWIKAKELKITDIIQTIDMEKKEVYND